MYSRPWFCTYLSENNPESPGDDTIGMPAVSYCTCTFTSHTLHFLQVSMHAPSATADKVPGYQL